MGPEMEHDKVYFCTVYLVSINGVIKISPNFPGVVPEQMCAPKSPQNNYIFMNQGESG